MKATLLVVTLVLSLGLSAVQARADLSASFSQDNLAAKATFVQDGTYLKIILQNTATIGAAVPEDALTGVYFTLSGVTLTPVRAVLGAGSTVLQPYSGTGVDANGEVGGEFAYRSGVSGLPSGANLVVASVGMDILGPHDLFPGADLCPPLSPDGLNYGIVSSIAANANNKVKDVPLIQDTVIFTLAGLPSTYDLAANLDLSDVMFNYGTGFNPMYGVPVPGAAVLGGIGLVLVGLWRRRQA